MSMTVPRRGKPHVCAAGLAIGLLLGLAQFGSAQEPTELPVTRVTAPVPTEGTPAPITEPSPPPTVTPPRSSVSGRTTPPTNAIGAPVSTSQGFVSQADIQNKPLFRTTEFFEQIPGLIFSNETNGIDANTMFLRGFLIDHGTDFAFFVDGVPMNLGSNPHAQGYTDLQFVIPELIATVDYGKGPYYAQAGNFSAVGYADVHYMDALPYGIAKVEAGKYDWFRTLVANSGGVGPGTLLYAVETNYFDNAFSTREDLNKTSVMFRYTIAEENDKFTLSSYLYNGQGTSEPVIPLRFTTTGQLSPFFNVSPTDFIVANRFMLNGQWRHQWDDGALTRANVYGYRFTLSLNENPSGFTTGPQGDQIDQIDQRWVVGANLEQTWKSLLFGDRAANTVGLQARHDAIGAGVDFVENRLFLGADSSAAIGESDVGVFYRNEFKWSDKVRTVLGVREELYHVDVTNHLTPENSGDKTSTIFLPKGSLVLGPWDQTEFYLNGGYSFHSNNAEGAVINVDPTTGSSTPREPLLVQARGAEVGVRSQAIPHLTTSAALWQLHLGSELIFDPVAETTTPLRSSDRYGVEWVNTYSLCDWLTLNADYSWAHGRLIGVDPNTPGQHIPDAPTTVFSGGPSVKLPDGLFANLRYRYWGPRYLIEDASASSRATNLFELSCGYECPRYTLNLQILNLFNSNGHDIDFYDTTFYPNYGDAAPKNDILYKPLQPFAMRFSVTMRW
jgi:hypothetical protein